MTLPLINTPDAFELIRDQVAAIIKTESAAQVALAVADGLTNSVDWDLRVYRERNNPWTEFLQQTNDLRPIVNVWFDNDTPNGGSSTVAGRQQFEGTINIDCYGAGRSKATTDGHTPGDQLSALNGQRALRLIRNIIMSDKYIYLGLRGTVWQRWITSRTCFQPSLDGDQAQSIVGCRLALRVRYNERSVNQPEDQLIEIIHVDINDDDGELLAEVENNF